MQGVGLRGVLARLFSFGRQEGAFVVTVSYLALFPKKPTTLARWVCSEWVRLFQPNVPPSDGILGVGRYVIWIQLKVCATYPPKKIKSSAFPQLSMYDNFGRARC